MVRRPPSKDLQRQLVYVVEDEFERFHPQPDLTEREAQQAANEVMQLPTWRDQALTSKPVIVSFWSETKSLADIFGTRIRLGVGGQNLQGVIHEMAHVLEIRSKGGHREPHGPEYCWLLINLWRDLDPELGTTWERLSLENGISSFPKKLTTVRHM